MTIPAITIAIAGAGLGLTGAGLAITVIVLLVRGGFLLGGLVRQVDSQEAKIDALDAKIDAKIDALDAKIDAKTDALDAKIDALTAAVHQTNAILVGLANHTHDADGRTVFTIPAGDRS